MPPVALQHKRASQVEEAAPVEAAPLPDDPTPEVAAPLPDDDIAGTAAVVVGALDDEAVVVGALEAVVVGAVEDDDDEAFVLAVLVVSLMFAVFVLAVFVVSFDKSTSFVQAPTSHIST